MISNPESSPSAFRPRNLFGAFAALLSTTGFFLVVFFLIETFLDQVLTDAIQTELMNPQGTSNLIWVFGGLSFSLGLVGPVLFSFLALCAWRYPQTSPFEVGRRSFSFLIKEEMRSLGQSLLWGLLLILPGLLRFFQLIFVPYIVLLDPEYQAGTVDALQRSRVQVKRVWGRLLLVFMIFGALIPLGLTSFDEWRSLTHQPLTALPLLFVELTSLLVFQWLVLKLWEKAHEPDVPLVRDFTPRSRLEL